jgi:hypothetical protein
VTYQGNFRIKDHLGNALAVAEVDKYQSAMVTAPGYPTGQRYLLAYVVFTKLTAAVALEQ